MGAGRGFRGLNLNQKELKIMWEKYLGAAAVVVVVLFLLHNFAPASVKSQMGIA